MIALDLTGRIALVTGATGDLGRVIALTLAHCGADVAVHYHGNRPRAEQLCAAIAKLGRRACAVQADVTTEPAVRAMQAEIATQLGPPAIVVANAVIQYAWTSALQQSPADFESQFRSCVMQNVYLAQAFAPAMIENGWGRIIGINTECTTQCYPTQSAYVAGKGGMHTLLQTLAKELGPHGITVNQVAPGWMLSDRDREGKTAAPQIQAVSQAYAAMLPLKHRGEDIDIAHAVAFLATDLARFITGAVLPLNGGGTVIPPWLQ